MLKTRIAAALVFAPALLWLVWSGGLVLTLTCLMLSVLMAWEYLQLVLGPGQPYLKSLGYVLAALVGASVLGLIPPALMPLVTPAGTLLLLLGVLARPEPLQQSTTRAGLLALGALYAGGLINYLTLLRDLPAGLALALMALFCTWGADTGAYFAGRFFGRHKLYPKISPKKTIEGLMGGILAAVAVSLLIRALLAPALPMALTLAIGAAAAVLGAAGDLCESMLKRSVGAKDSSRLIPGHGGVLDRFDGVMFAAPSVYVLVQLFGS